MWLALLVALAAPIDTTRLEAALGDVPPDFKAVVVVLPQAMRPGAGSATATPRMTPTGTPRLP
ncbi:MAG: hypothetical protein R3F60_16605 [bacterium]